MRRATRWAMWLYPSAWRKRYAREFEALLDDVGPGPRDFDSGGNSCTAASNDDDIGLQA